MKDVEPKPYVFLIWVIALYKLGRITIFFEVNKFLDFDRDEALGFRLNIPAGMAVRFEPGQRRTVELVTFAGKQEVYGFQGAIMGKLQDRS